MSDLGFVVGRFAIALSKNPVNGGEPRLYPLNGQVEFVPIEVGPLYDDGDPVSVSEEPVTVDLDSDGYVLSHRPGIESGSRGTYLAIGDYWVYVRSQYLNAVRPFTIEVTTEYTKSNPLDLTLAQPYRPMIGNALIQDRIRAELALKDALEERQYIRDMFLGGSVSISDAATAAFVEEIGSETDRALKGAYASLSTNGLIKPEQMPVATTVVRGALEPSDKERIAAAVLASDLSEGIKSAVLAGHGEITGEDGRAYNLIGGVIRPPTAGGDWVLHTNSTHPTVGVTNITTTDTEITLHYPGHGHSGVVSFLAVTDETLATHGVTSGCSITTTQAKIRLGGRVGYGGQIRWASGVGLHVVNNDSHSAPDTVSVAWDTDTAVISHPRLPVANNDVSPKVSGRTAHLHQISTRVSLGNTGFGIQRRNLTDGTLNTTQSDYFAMFENYTHGRLNPRSFVGNHWTWANIWYLGVFQKY